MFFWGSYGKSNAIRLKKENPRNPNRPKETDKKKFVVGLTTDVREGAGCVRG